jgi:hypothetical protein
MGLSLWLSLLAQTKPWRLHGGYHRGITKPNHGGLRPHNHFLNPAAVPVVSYEYPFYRLSNDRLWPPFQLKA